MQTTEIIVASAVRTAIGTFGGGLKDHAPVEMAGKVVAEAVARAGIAAEQVGHSVFGQVLPTERRDLYMGRVAALLGGLPDTTPALTVNRLCGSGLQAIVSATQQIELGVCKAAVAGGAESMSRTQYWAPSGRWGQRMGDAQLVDSMVGALTCPFENVHMGITAENIAAAWGISREAQDELALLSHQRAQAAIESGRFAEQILPMVSSKRGQEVVFAQDEHVRLNAKIEDFSGCARSLKKRAR